MAVNFFQWNSEPTLISGNFYTMFDLESSSSSESEEFTADGWTWGEDSPPVTETTPVEWTVWKFKESSTEATNTSAFGELQLRNFESFVSDVKDSLTTQEKQLAITFDDFETGFGSGDFYYRSSNTEFAQDSNEVAGPTWILYSNPVQITNRYIQIMAVR